MQSRIRTVIPPEKRQPSVFKALCLQNTGFMVDFLGFFTRDDFEKYLQLTCKRMNQLILTHFHSKPYRYLDNVTLSFHLDDVRGMTMSLIKRPSINSPPTVGWDPNNRQWDNFANEVRFPTMCPFLDKTVRVPKVIIWNSDRGILTPENIDQLKSISDIWENAQVKFKTPRCMNESLMSRAEQLSEAKLFRCRRFICSYWNAMLPLWDYPEIYSLEVVDVNISYAGMNRNLTSNLTQLVENQAFYPHCQTTFVFSGTKYAFTPLFTNNLLQHIRTQFKKSDKAQSFQIVFAVNERFEVSDGEMDEFRLENDRTQEVLQFRHVTHDKVVKYCKFDATTKYFVFKRSHV